MSRAAALYIGCAVFDLASLAPFVAAALLVAAGGWLALRAYRRAAPERPAPRWGVALIAAAGLAVLGVYVAIGVPGLPGGSYAAREAALLRADPATFQAEEWRAYLNAKARAAPDDPEPLFLLGVIEAQLGRAEPAARAFEAALRRDPNYAPALFELGRVQFQLDQGAASPRTRALFEAAARAMPNEPLVWFYQALAADQDGRSEDAARHWRAAQRLFPADDPRQAMIAQRLAGEGGADAAPR